MLSNALPIAVMMVHSGVHTPCEPNIINLTTFCQNRELNLALEHLYTTRTQSRKERLLMLRVQPA